MLFGYVIQISHAYITPHVREAPPTLHFVAPSRNLKCHYGTQPYAYCSIPAYPDPSATILRQRGHDIADRRLLCVAASVIARLHTNECVPLQLGALVALTTVICLVIWHISEVVVKR